LTSGITKEAGEKGEYGSSEIASGGAGEIEISGIEDFICKSKRR